MYSFGCNDEGALGRVTGEGEEQVPSKVSGLESTKIVLVSAGDSHSAYLTDKGSVYISGTFRVCYRNIYIYIYTVNIRYLECPLTRTFVISNEFSFPLKGIIL